MRMRRRRRIVSDSPGNSIQLLSLSLFIMLLAFFIVLNSVSSFEDEKITPIMGSLEKTFSTRLQNIPLQRPSTRSDEMDSRGEGQVSRLDELEELFRSQITALKIEVNRETGTMWVRGPYDKLNEAIMAAALPVRPQDESEDSPYFLPTLISLLNTLEQGRAMRMDMLLNVEENPLEVKLDNPADFVIQRDRIGKFARVLEQAGLPALQISVGLNKGEKDMVDLIFRPFTPHDALKGQNIDEPSNNTSQAGGVL